MMFCASHACLACMTLVRLCRSVRRRREVACGRLLSQDRGLAVLHASAGGIRGRRYGQCIQVGGVRRPAHLQGEAGQGSRAHAKAEPVHHVPRRVRHGARGDQALIKGERTMCPLPCSFGYACLFDNWHLRELEIGSVFCNILTVQAVVIDCRLS